MCGISALLLSNKTNENWYCFNILIRSLKALQNRGYDSCGIIDSNFKSLLRTVKKSEMNNIQDNDLPDDAVEQLILYKNKFPKNSFVGMAHTRWATSGKKTVNNAHPHVSSDGNVAVVHNGIIENYITLRTELKKEGWDFKSETDTEIISNWIARRINEIKKEKITEENILDVLKDANKNLEGTWAITVIHKDFPDSIFISRRGNPLLIGLSQSSDIIMIASEISGFVNLINKYAILSDNNVLHLKRGFTINDINKQLPLNFYDVPREIIQLTPGDFPYFMAKEIYDQEDAIYGPCEWGKYRDRKLKDIPELKQLSLLKENLSKFDGYDVLLIGCGTSYHSGLSGKMFFNSYPFRSVQCIIASEFTIDDLPKRLNKNPNNVIAVFISQSGETLDTYKALKIIKNTKIPTISLVNVENSMIARECDYSLYLHAGREVGVASTKAYVTQIIGLNLLSLYLKSEEETKIPKDYLLLSSQIKETLKKCFPYSPKAKDNKHLFICTKPFFNIIKSLNIANHGFVLASGSLQATSYEASLKIKEIGRIFIQGYPTASLKHGPFSLIQEGVPILFALQKGDENILRKTNSAIEEVHLRGASIYLITDIEDYSNDKVHEIIKIPHNKTFSSILQIIPFQVISYFLSGIRDLNCDRPLNLAKCVTTD